MKAKTRRKCVKDERKTSEREGEDKTQEDKVKKKARRQRLGRRIWRDTHKHTRHVSRGVFFVPLFSCLLSSPTSLFFWYSRLVRGLVSRVLYFVFTFLFFLSLFFIVLHG